MRIPKDPFFAHQVMWDGWVDTELSLIHIFHRKRELDVYFQEHKDEIIKK